MPFLYQNQFYESIGDAIEALGIISIHDVNLDNPNHYGINPAIGRGQFKVNLTVDTEIAQDYFQEPEETETLLKSLRGTPLRFYQQFYPFYRQHWIRWYDEAATQKTETVKTRDGYTYPDQVGITHVVIDSQHAYRPNFFSALWYDPYYHISPSHRGQCFLTDLNAWILKSPSYVIILNEEALKPKIIELNQTDLSKPSVTRTRRA